MPRTMYNPSGWGKGGVEKGDRVPGRLVAKADRLADAASEAALAAGQPAPYMPLAPLIMQYGYDIIAKATAAALPKGCNMSECQAGTWFWLRGSA